MTKALLTQDIQFGREICGDLEQAERREWWLGNGLGAYAAGTIAGTLTRRYHGLLIAPVVAPLGRMLVFAKADALVLDGDHEYPLFTNRWGGGAVEPSGYKHIQSFRLDGRMPVWRYELGSAVIESRVWIEPGKNATFIAYRFETADTKRAPLKLRIRLLINARDHHGATSVDTVQPELQRRGSGVVAKFGDWFDFHLDASGGEILPTHDWIDNFDLPVERERGLDDRDRHLAIGLTELTLRPNEWVGVSGSLGQPANAYIEESMRRFINNDQRILVKARAVSPWLVDSPQWVNRLALSADTFVFSRPLPDQSDGESVIAGYPWFGDWGRDTMIALPGLTLPTGRFDSARRILNTFARFIDRGMLPNYFPGAGQTAEYNTADAALWYIEAWRAYVTETFDIDALRAVWPKLEDIITHYRNGTRYGIALDETDGLIRAGQPGVQLTWMDAKVGDHVFTPRIGKPVEINALWFNAVCAMAALADRLGLNSDPYMSLIAAAQRGFGRFVRADGLGLYDVIDTDSGNDDSIRPNQVFAVSLHYSALDNDQQLAIVRTCGDHLLASYGLRSLASSHPDYRGRYLGDVWARDSSYHQGPVWAWLLGPYARAHFRVFGDIAAARRLLEPMRDHLNDAALGSISEILDGDAPHCARGAPSQAWSVACTLDAWWHLARAEQSLKRQRESNIPVHVEHLGALS